MRILRFRPDAAAEQLGPEALPVEPGGDVWCDLAREDLQAAETAQQDALRAWLQRLHPLTVATLRRSSPQHIHAAQEHYVHLRLQAVPQDRPPALPAALVASGKNQRGPEIARLSKVGLDVVVGDRFALTVHEHALAPLDAVWQSFCEGQFKADSVDFALYHGLGALVEGYRRAAQRLTSEAEGVNQHLVRLSARHMLTEIVRVRRHAVDLRDVLVPARDGLQLLGGGGTIRSENRPYFEDLEREVAESVTAVESARQSMGEAVEAFTSVQSTQMNRVMQLFTVLAVVIAPPMLVASIYGMNFKIPEYHWPHGYSYALGLMFLLMASLYIYVRAKRWL